MHTPTQLPTLAVAQKLATALDAEDYDAALALLSVQCEYSCRGQVHRGPAAIIDSYRSAGEAARHDFDSITYESEVAAIDDSRACIDFIDHLTHNGQQFTFRCQQTVEVDDAGQIVRIEHVDLPGQREALAEFIARTKSTS